MRKGEKSTSIFFTKRYAVKDKDAEDDATKQVRLLKHYAVFHLSQIEGAPAYVPPTLAEAPWRRPEAAELILKNSGMAIRIGGESAFFSPSTDHVQMPPDNAFFGPLEWSSTALHEGVHWSGAANRLARDLTGKFESKTYAFEELIAEIGSAFLGLTLSIPANTHNHASYLEHWLKILKEDKRAIFRAAASAQRAADYLLEFHPDWKPDRPVDGLTVNRGSYLAVPSGSK